MRFRKFIKFLKGGDVEQYLTRDVGALVDDLSAGLHKMDLTENFSSHRVTVSISRDAQTAISHPFKQIPRYFIVLNGVAGVVTGVNKLTSARAAWACTDWSNENIYLILDNDVYAAGITRAVDLIIFK